MRDDDFYPEDERVLTELVWQCKKRPGDRHLDGYLKRLFHHVRRTLVAVISKETRDHNLAEDVVQDTLIKVNEIVRQGKLEARNYRMFVKLCTTTARNRLRTIVRKPAVRDTDVHPPDKIEFLSNAQARVFHETDERAHEFARMKRALMKLDAPCRRLLIYVEKKRKELTQTEIAINLKLASARAVRRKVKECTDRVHAICKALPIE